MTRAAAYDSTKKCGPAMASAHSEPKRIRLSALHFVDWNQLACSQSIDCEGSGSAGPDFFGRYLPRRFINDPSPDDGHRGTNPANCVVRNGGRIEEVTVQHDKIGKLTRFD